MAESTKYDRILDMARRLVDAERRSLRACNARGSLPYGSSRAKVTTANARWARAAEERDRAEIALRDSVIAAGLVSPDGYWGQCAACGRFDPTTERRERSAVSPDAAHAFKGGQHAHLCATCSFVHCD